VGGDSEQQDLLPYRDPEVRGEAFHCSRPLHIWCQDGRLALELSAALERQNCRVAKGREECWVPGSGPALF
jgi:hypothetical protein